MADTASRLPNNAMTRGGVAGLFRSESQAENALEELKSAGFAESEIGIATAHDESKTASFWDKVTSKLGKHERTEQASDFHESLTDSGISDQQARYFNSALGEGGVLITVHTDPQRSQEALRILERNGADVGARAAEVSSREAELSSREAELSSREATPNVTGAEQRIQLVGEILRVHKERVSRGEVRLRKEVVTEQQNIDVPVTREELVIERVPGEGREASAGIGSGQSEIRVPLSEERVQVEKKPVVNEEVRVGKREVQETKRVADQVRHEELRSDTEADLDEQSARTLRDKGKTRRSA